MDLPRSFVIRESGHRIHNPLTAEKLAALGRALALEPGTRALDLASGSGEMLCTWARDHGVPGTVELLQRSLRPGGLMLIGHPYRRLDPPDRRTVEACHARDRSDFLPLPDLIAQFADLGYDTVEMMLADQDSWDRYRAAQWLNIRRWLDRDPDDELAAEFREELSTDPVLYTRDEREYLGWGVFALMRR